MQESVKSPFSWAFETCGDPQLAAMLTAAQQFCADLSKGEKPRWLCLLGTSGAGKTHLARKINEYFQRYVEGTLLPGQDADRTQWRAKGGFISWRKLTNELRNGEYGRFQVACADYFVAIDDVGSEHESRFIVSKLDELCDSRQKKWTVLTANLSLAQFAERMDVRIASRMTRNGSAVVDVDVTDYNQRRVAA